MNPLTILVAALAMASPTGVRSFDLPAVGVGAPRYAEVGVFARPSPHAAVARIIVPESDGTSFGSGSLVDVQGDYGLVVTNWHVVRDAAGTIEVLFPDGFRSAGKLIKTDRDWDLAAIAIWRPQVDPIRLSSSPPKRGDLLTIAGYGGGTYRAASGRFVQYVAPATNLPYEMVEVAAAARNGDSGGPILNDQGELAGVLFGTGGGRTSGSYCGRVQQFLGSVVPQSVDEPAAEPIANIVAARVSSISSPDVSPEVSSEAPSGPVPAVVPLVAVEKPEAAATAPASEYEATETVHWMELLGATPADRARSALAALGVLALLAVLPGRLL